MSGAATTNSPTGEYPMIVSSSPLRVHWIVAHVEGTRESGFQTSLASNRCRAIWPAL